MNTPQTDNKKIRLIMDLRNKGVSDMGVLSAMERVPREEFIPAESRDKAWEDMALPIARGQTISQPLIVASMTAALKIKSGDTVLEIGTGCGYQTAILANLARRVYTIERHKILHDEATQRLDGLKIRNITAIAGDGMQGWPSLGRAEPPSFDKIIVTAAARIKPPQALLDQLKEGGLMIVPVGEAGEQMLKLYRKESHDAFAIRDVMPVRFVPLLPDVE